MNWTHSDFLPKYSTEAPWPSSEPGSLWNLLGQASPIHISLGILVSLNSQSKWPLKFYPQHFQAFPAQSSQFFFFHIPPTNSFQRPKKTQECLFLSVGSKARQARKGFLWLTVWGCSSSWWGWCGGVCIASCPAGVWQPPHCCSARLFLLLFTLGPQPTHIQGGASFLSWESLETLFTDTCRVCL